MWKKIVVVLFVMLLFPAQIVFAQARFDIGRLNTAFGNLLSEVSERVEASPAVLAELLLETLTNGETRLYVDHTGQWGGTVVDLAFISNFAERDFMLSFEVEDSPFVIDMDIFVNPQRMAISLPMYTDAVFGDVLYGFEFATYEEDIRAFGEAIGEDFTWLLREVRLAEMWETMVNFEMPDLSFTQPYMRLLTRMILSAELSAERTTLGGVNVTRKTMTFSGGDIATLLNELADTLEADDIMRAAYNGVRGTLFWSRYDWLIEDIRDAAEYLTDGYTDVSVSINFYLTDANRLARAELVFEVDEDGWGSTVELTADFGTGVTGSWAFNYSMREHYDYDGIDKLDLFLPRHWRYPYEETSSFEWNFSRANGVYVHTFTTEEHTPWRTRPITTSVLEISWAPRTGAVSFTTTYNDDAPETVSGTLLVNDDRSFNMRFESSNERTSWRGDVFTETTLVILTGTPGVQVPVREFINIRELDQAFIDRAEAFYDSLW
jgi:hypothetical protein